VNGHISEACSLHKTTKQRGICQYVLGSSRRGRRWSEVAIQNFRHYVGHRIALNGGIHIQGEPTIGLQHTPTLSQSGRSIWEELQPQLTEHEIEGRIREGHVECATLTPLGGRANRLGD